jgi:aminoglycoside phosphotransferase
VNDDLLRRCLTEREYATHRPVQLGESGACVVVIPAQVGGVACFIKIDRVDSHNSLRREQAVLRHLSSVIPVPRVLDFAQVGRHEVLRMSVVPGVDASDARLHGEPRRMVEAYARALRQMHALPITAHMDFDRRLAVTVAEAEQRLQAGRVDLEELDDEREGLSLDALAAQLHEQRPQDEDLVTAHGDYCLPNVLFDPATCALGGFVDLGRFGVADRHLDLALAERSLRHNDLGDWTGVFFDAYGIAPDWGKIAFYQLLDEFF